jgi:hypothetical protein
VLGKGPRVRRRAPGADDEAHERAGLLHPPLRVRLVLDVEAQHVARRVAQVGAGIGVVGDERDAVRRQAIGARREQRVARPGWDPRIDAVRDHVVEPAEVVRERLDVALEQPHVAGAELGGERGPAGDRLGGEVDADELAAGQAERHRDQVAAVAAAQLQHAAAGRRCGTQPEQRRLGGEAVRVRLRVRVPLVGDCVVRVGQRVKLHVSPAVPGR